MKEYVEYILAHRQVEYFDYWTGEQVEYYGDSKNVIESRCSMCTTHPPYMCICKISNISPAHLTTNSSGTGEATENYLGRFFRTYGRYPRVWVEYDSPEGIFWLDYYSGEFWPHVTIPLEEDIVESWYSDSKTPRDFRCLWSRMFTITPRHVKGLLRG